jgi:hypothetical protein
MHLDGEDARRLRLEREVQFQAKTLVLIKKGLATKRHKKPQKEEAGQLTFCAFSCLFVAAST